MSSPPRGGGGIAFGIGQPGMSESAASPRKFPKEGAAGFGRSESAKASGGARFGSPSPAPDRPATSGSPSKSAMASQSPTNGSRPVSSPFRRMLDSARSRSPPLAPETSTAAPKRGLFNDTYEPWADDRPSTARRSDARTVARPLPTDRTLPRPPPGLSSVVAANTALSTTLNLLPKAGVNGNRQVALPADMQMGDLEGLSMEQRNAVAGAIMKQNHELLRFLAARVPPPPPQTSSFYPNAGASGSRSPSRKRGWVGEGRGGDVSIWSGAAPQDGGVWRRKDSGRLTSASTTTRGGSAGVRMRSNFPPLAGPLAEPRTRPVTSATGVGGDPLPSRGGYEEVVFDGEHDAVDPQWWDGETRPQSRNAFAQTGPSACVTRAVRRQDDSDRAKVRAATVVDSAPTTEAAAAAVAAARGDRTGGRGVSSSPPPPDAGRVVGRGVEDPPLTDTDSAAAAAPGAAGRDGWAAREGGAAAAGAPSPRSLSRAASASAAYPPPARVSLPPLRGALALPTTSVLRFPSSPSGSGRRSPTASAPEPSPTAPPAPVYHDTAGVSGGALEALARQVARLTEEIEALRAEKAARQTTDEDEEPLGDASRGEDGEGGVSEEVCEKISELEAQIAAHQSTTTALLANVLSQLQSSTTPPQTEEEGRRPRNSNSSRGPPEFALLGVDCADRLVLSSADGRTEEHLYGAVKVADAYGPSAAAGIRAGDLILAVDGKPVMVRADMRAAVRKIKPGDRVALDISRDLRKMRVLVVAGTSDTPSGALAYRNYYPPNGTDGAPVKRHAFRPSTGLGSGGFMTRTSRPTTRGV